MVHSKETQTRGARPRDAMTVRSESEGRPSEVLLTHSQQVRLLEWMTTNVAGFCGPIRMTRFAGGQSNPTYRISADSADYVLRRKPPGLLLKGAHAIEREARVLAALESTGFPVPHLHALCTDDGVIGSWFYIMDLIEGRIFWDSALPELSQPERSAYLDALNATLATLHLVKPDQVGLEDYGRPENYVSRQIARWSKQYADDMLVGRNPHMDKLVEWLPKHLPCGEESAVVHGDFRIDNVIFHPSEPRVLAVLDWELSTLGHPLADFAYHAMMYRFPPDIFGGLAGTDMHAAGLPDEAAYVAAYCCRTCRAGIPDLGFYIAFNMFRFAAILHGIRGRLLRGNAAGADAAAKSALFERVAALAWAQASPPALA